MLYKEAVNSLYIESSHRFFNATVHVDRMETVAFINKLLPHLWELLTKFFNDQLMWELFNRIRITKTLLGHNKELFSLVAILFYQSS
jgi:hypothetical protein